MSFVDWSDPEALLSLLVEHVEDERADADAARRRMLAQLLRQLGEMERDPGTTDAAQRCDTLRQLAAEVDTAFGDDPVVQHLRDCADEFERLAEAG